jgi:hypothetical protein
MRSKESLKGEPQLSERVTRGTGAALKGRRDRQHQNPPYNSSPARRAIAKSYIPMRAIDALSIFLEWDQSWTQIRQL